MSKYLMDWTMSLVRRRTAICWLAFIAFIESSVFPMPTDMLFMPLTLVKPKRAWQYAFIATFFSVLGGIAGWLFGYFAYELIARPILEFYDQYNQFEILRKSASVDFICLLLITSSLIHLPPAKIVTILSGVVGINICFFILLAVLTRCARFYFLAWLLSRYGSSIIRSMMSINLSKFFLIFSTLLIVIICIIYQFIL
ncbi:MAG: putative membrane protein [Candidatus Tokpelaia sp. JSC085]|nr:MAG: putative membrane protein [Candidatus Tokpelaia sp. JSC085]